MSDIPIQFVDETDKPIGSGSITEAHETGAIHRIVRVMVEDSNGRILLQKRNADSRLFPGCWDNSAAGHVDKDEDYLEAAKREMEEEIGLSGYELEEVSYYRSQGKFEDRKLNRFSKIYKVVVPADTKFVLQSDEVTAVRWYSLTELEDLVSNNPVRVTDGLEQTVERVYENKFDSAAG